MTNWSWCLINFFGHPSFCSVGCDSQASGHASSNRITLHIHFSGEADELCRSCQAGGKIQVLRDQSTVFLREKKDHLPADLSADGVTLVSHWVRQGMIFLGHAGAQRVRKGMDLLSDLDNKDLETEEQLVVVHKIKEFEEIVDQLRRGVTNDMSDRHPNRGKRARPYMPRS